MPRKIPLSRYICTRLLQQNVHHIHGVPGDFSLRFLDAISTTGQQWIGSTNELCAGYAADGYSRVRGLSALITTYGVGELSAINAIAGSYAEGVSVCHIVGTPSRRLLRERRNIHHSLGDGRLEVWRDIARSVTCAQAWLADVQDRNLTAEVDRVIGTGVRESLPVYLGVPADVGLVEVEAEALDEDLDVEGLSSVDEKQEHTVAEEVLHLLSMAKQPLLLVDSGGGVRHLRSQINEFVKGSSIPTLCMPSGNDMVDHSHPNFYGVHSGPVGQIDTMPYVEGADLVLAFGPMFSDTQTLGWKVLAPPGRMMTLSKSNVSSPMLQGGKKIKINLKRFLNQLTSRLTALTLPSPPPPAIRSLGNFRTMKPPAYSSPMTPHNLDAQIDQSSFYLRLSSYLRPNDTIILGVATPILGGRDLVLPKGGRIIASGQWFSIGSMFPLATGVSLARKTQQSRSRTILIDGDGGFQATGQDLGNAMRYRIPLTIFLVNNNGYAYERLIHGREADYNDLPPWRYTEVARAFGASERQLGDGDREYPVRNHTVRTWRQLEDVLGNEEFVEGKGLQFVEVRMGQFDVPERFRGVFESAGKALGN